VIFAHGSRFGGHSLFIKDKKLYYVYNFLGIKPEQEFISTELKPGKYTVGMEFIREGTGKHGESLGKTKLYVNDKVVAEGPMRTQPGKFTLSGDGLCIGYDSDDAVSQEYKSPLAAGRYSLSGSPSKKLSMSTSKRKPQAPSPGIRTRVMISQREGFNMRKCRLALDELRSNSRVLEFQHTW
jgi:hypothetical protein